MANNLYQPELFQPTPYKPTAAPKTDTQWLDRMGYNWNIGSNYNQDFLSRYDNVMGGQWNGGQWGGNQMYDSDLLSQLTGKVSSNLANPQTSTEMGLLKDQFAGQRNTEQQALNDRFAGYGRGYGPQAAQQLALSDQLNRSESQAKRESLADIMQRSINDAMGLEGLNSGNFNAYQNRGLAAFEGAQNRSLSDYNNRTSALGTLADYLGGQAALDSANQQTSFGNLENLYSLTNQAKMSDWQNQDNYLRQYQDYLNTLAQQPVDKSNYLKEQQTVKYNSLPQGGMIAEGR